MPRAGKSECISIVEHLFRRHGFSVLTPSEGASQAPDYLKKPGRLVSYNTWTATYAIRQIIEGCNFGDPRRYYDIVLLDRGLFDATAWFHFLQDEGQLSKADLEVLTTFLRVSEWSKRIHQVFFFTCNANTSLFRERKSKLTEKVGMVMEAGFLSRLKRAYGSALNCYGDHFNVARLKTDNRTSREVAFEIATKIMEGIQKEAVNQIMG